MEGERRGESGHCSKAGEERCCSADRLVLSREGGAVLSPAPSLHRATLVLPGARGTRTSSQRWCCRETVQTPLQQQAECAWKEDGITVVSGPRGSAAISVNQLYENLWGQKSNKITEDKPMLPLCTFHLSSHFILPSHKISSLWPDLVM